jgi:hypothetical protein
MNAAALALREAEHGLQSGREIATIDHGEFTFAARASADDLWVCISRGEESGGLAWRVPLLSDEAKVVKAEGDNLLDLAATSPLGRHRISVETDESETSLFVLTVAFEPARALHTPYLPRDLIALGPPGRTERPRGKIEARQRRLNTGMCYFELTEPDFGKVLYVQDLTELNAYFNATGTKPENAVGGVWPEVGYLPPTNPKDPTTALPAGRETVLSRGYLLIRRFLEQSETMSAWQFLDMLAAVYRRIGRPEVKYRNWIERSERTLEDLATSPKTRTWHDNNLYFHPYTDSEYPDSMVQLSLAGAIHEWGRWSGRKSPLEREIVRGLRGFYDGKLKALRRYLSDVGDDKDADAVDSWYLYHPMRNLAVLAAGGDEDARALFFDIIDYGIEAAHHFKYKWPIQFKIDTFEVITAVAADDRGQTDVGGMYAWVMLQAFELSHEQRFLDEAMAAIAAAEGMRFNLNYQANLTAWGAAACIKLWRITGDKHYLAQSYVYLASFFHNCQLWESEIGLAKQYSNFLGATCLQDAPYMAIYECFDSYAAFERYLDFGGPDVIPSVKLLVSEYCRYALDRAWYFYPDALPADGLATENRNGHIDRELSFPVEDLYPDGQPAGQVGQEIYGAGAAMVFATRSFYRIDGAPFVIHCDRFARAITRINERSVSFALDGPSGLDACISLVAPGGLRTAFEARMWDSSGKQVEPDSNPEDVLCRFTVPSQGAYTLDW